MKFKFYLLYIAVFAICLTISNSSRAQAVNTQDSLVLIDFIKAAQNGQSSNWRAGTQVSTWNGVVIKNSRVTEAHISFTLTSFPASVGNLDSLTVFELHNIYYNTNMPASFWKLHSLTVLNLASANINGVLSDSLVNLPKLVYLNFSNNYIVGNNNTPNAVGKLSNLTYLNLNKCNIQSLNISSIGHLSLLESLDLGANEIPGSIPSFIDSLPYLTWLNLSFNQFSSTLNQTNWGKLTALHTLLLNNNNITGTVPAPFAQMPALDTIQLQNNNLTNVGQLTNLTPLSVINVANNYLSFNGLEPLAKNFVFATYAPQKPIVQITYNPSSLSISAGGTLSNNTYNWYKNDTLVATITGDSTYPNPLDEHYTVRITNSVAQQLTLFNLDLAAIQDSLALVDLYNSLNGSKWKKDPYGNPWWSLGATVKTLRGVTVTGGRVTAINLNNINLKGTLPTSIGALTALKSLDIGGNNITGEFPETFGNLRKLETLKIRNGTFQSLPAFITRLTRLKYVDLYNATASGTIPTGIDSLINLEYLDLSYDSLTGTIPSSLGNIAGLKYLILSSNSFASQAIPASFSSLTSLQTLKLQQDSLTGSIPAFLGSLPAISTVWLNQNNLTGNLPSSFAKHFHTFMMGHNNITGSIPDGLTGDSLDLSYNQFTDTIPASVGQVNYGRFAMVNLGYNKLTGHVPASLGDYQVFRVYLNNNQLTGAIPGSFNYEHSGMGYNDYGILDVRNNNLTGPIPPLNDFFIENDYYDADIDEYVYIRALVYASYNRFNFSGLVGNIIFGPQKNQPIYKQGNTLYMMAGDTLANDTFRLFRNGVLVQAHLGDSAFVITTTGSYNITAKNKRLGGFTLYTDTLLITGDSLILPASPNTLYANAEYTDTAGWTNYYYNNNTPNDITDDTLLLSIKKNGQNIGTIGDGTFNVKLAATDGAGSNTGIFLSSPLITNTSGYWVMNRYWHVTPTTQPSAPVGVRFYYNNQDVADVNGSYPGHDLHKDSLLFYKAIGGDPDPTTGLSGATDIISILPGSTATTTTYTYHAISDTTQYAEYMVSSFSGGGGGGTGNKQALPVTLLNFTAKNYFKINHLSWQTTQEVNSAYFEVQKSTDNSTYTSIGTVTAQGNSSITSSYNFDDVNPASGNNYYRLKIVDKDAQYSYSKVVLVKNNGGTGISLYPNPAKTTVQISFANIQAGRYSVTVCTTGGKIVAAKTYTLGTGSQTISLPLSQYANGIYIVKITDSEGQVISTEKVVKE